MWLEMKNFNMIINREASKISASSSARIDNYEYLKGEEILPSNLSQLKELTKFIYSYLGKTLDDALKSLNISNIRDDKLKQIESIFSKNKLTNMITSWALELIKLQNNIKTDELGYKSASGVIYKFSKYSLPIVFMRDIPIVFMRDIHI